MRSTYTRHLEERFDNNHSPCCDGETHLWGDVFGEWQQQNAYGQQFGYNDTTVGGTIGADYCATNFLVGVAASYTHDNLNWKQSAGHAKLDSYYGGVYARWNSDQFFVNVAALGGQNRYKTSRHLHFATIDREAHGTSKGHEWLVGGGFGFNLQSCDVEWTPYVNLDYVYLHQNGFTENGASSLNLDVHGKNSELFQGEVGVEVTRAFFTCGGVWTPKVKLAYVNQSPIANKKYQASFVDSTCTYSVTGLNFERNLFAPSIGLTYQGCCDAISISVRYDAEIGSKNYWAQGGGVQVDVRF